MAATVLNSSRAVEMSVFVVRAFVRLREVLAGHKELAVKIGKLEGKLHTHDESIQHLIQTIKQLMPMAGRNPRRIGFQPKLAERPKLLKGCVARAR